MYNSNKLRGLIKEKGLTEEKVAESINNNKSTFSLKINGKMFFDQDDIYNLIELLEIQEKNIKEYFFCKTSLEKQN